MSEHRATRALTDDELRAWRDRLAVLRHPSKADQWTLARVEAAIAERQLGTIT